MKVRRTILAAAAAVAVSTAGALALPAVAGAQSATHTLKVISVTGKTVVFGKSAAAQQDADVNSAGQPIGFDLLHVTLASGSSGTVKLVVDGRAGFLYGTADINLKSGAVSHGRVTGGTGSYLGASGTFTARNLNASGTRTLLTFHYHG
jgi:hypothetical protein